MSTPTLKRDLSQTTTNVTPLHARYLSDQQQDLLINKERREQAWRESAYDYLDACFNGGSCKVIQELADEMFRVRVGKV